MIAFFLLSFYRYDTFRCIILKCLYNFFQTESRYWCSVMPINHDSPRRDGMHDLHVILGWVRLIDMHGLYRPIYVKLLFSRSGKNPYSATMTPRGRCEGCCPINEKEDIAFFSYSRCVLGILRVCMCMCVILYFSIRSNTGKIWVRLVNC